MVDVQRHRRPFPALHPDGQSRLRRRNLHRPEARHGRLTLPAPDLHPEHVRRALAPVWRGLVTSAYTMFRGPVRSRHANEGRVHAQDWNSNTTRPAIWPCRMRSSTLLTFSSLSVLTVAL